MYKNPRSRVRVNGFFSDDFLVQAVSIASGFSVKCFDIYHGAGSTISLHQQWMSRTTLWSWLCISGSFERLKVKLEARKGALESKGLTVNINKTKMMTSSENATKVTKCKFSCTVYRKSVDENSVFRIFCRCWMHKR